MKGSILIVDDEAVVRKSLCRTLARDNYQCIEAGTAEEALRKMEGNPFDLTILDIMMPGKSGLELLPEVKAKYPTTAVIMITALTDIGVVTRCMKAGATDYIPKPFDLDEVALSVKQSLEKRQFEIEMSNRLQGLECQVETKNQKIREIFLGAVESLAFALEAKDKYTAGHSQRVADLVTAIGGEIGIPQDELEDLRCAAILHDIGKIAIDPAIQNKPGKLTPDEYRHIMTHAQVGPDIVKPLVNENIIEVIKHHHDRYDGGGLDQEVAREGIPLGARVIAVADTFDAMTSDRPYRKGMPIDQALKEIKKCSGTQFDPQIVDVLLNLASFNLVMAF